MNDFPSELIFLIVIAVVSISINIVIFSLYFRKRGLRESYERVTKTNKTEDLENNPSEILSDVFEFLSLLSYDKVNFEKKHNVSKYEPMSDSSRRILKEFFKPCNKSLYEFLKRDFEWDF